MSNRKSLNNIQGEARTTPPGYYLYTIFIADDIHQQFHCR